MDNSFTPNTADRLQAFKDAMSTATTDEQKRAITRLLNVCQKQLRAFTEGNRLYVEYKFPATQDTVLEERSEFIAHLSVTAEDDDSERYDLLSHGHAVQMVQALENRECSTDGNGLGCKLWKRALNDRHSKKNLRNTVSQVPGKTHLAIGRQFHCYELALVAAGRVNELKATGIGSGLQVSHLCHNPACFNADHLVVESSTLNLQRNACRDACIVKHPTGMYHPCPHAATENRKRCIIRTVDVGPGVCRAS